MLKLNGELFQWEKNRFVEVEEGENNITIVQFYNKNAKIGPEVEVVEGKAQIPDYLLRESCPLIALCYSKDGDNVRIIDRQIFKIIARAKPDSYVDEEVPTTPQEPDIIYDGGVEE